MTGTNQLDPEIANLLDLSAIIDATDAAAAKLANLLAFTSPIWLANLVVVALGANLTLGQAIGASVKGRVHSGYYPEGERRATRALSYSNSLPVVS